MRRVAVDLDEYTKIECRFQIVCFMCASFFVLLLLNLLFSLNVCSKQIHIGFHSALVSKAKLLCIDWSTTPIKRIIVRELNQKKKNEWTRSK